MLTARIGGRQNGTDLVLKRIILYTAGLLAFFISGIIILQKFSYSHDGNLTKDMVNADVPHQQAEGPCGSIRTNCPSEHFSFSIISGAANVIAPKICLENKLILGTEKNNAGSGINIVVLNGKTGEVVKTGAFNMYDGDVKPLIDLLQSLEVGNTVLMAAYDEPATKLNEVARNLIAELGSSAIKSIGFRDNWVFVGGKGGGVKSTFEKHIKNDGQKNKYEGWPEILDLEGCIPQYLE